MVSIAQAIETDAVETGVWLAEKALSHGSRRRLLDALAVEPGDPMAIALTLGLIAWIESPDTYGLENLVLVVVRQLGLGLLVVLKRIFAPRRRPHAPRAHAPRTDGAARRRRDLTT